MKNILILVAHPKEESFSFAMANTYKEVKASKGDSVEFLDLYRSEHLQGFFTYDDPNERKVTYEMRYYQEKITKADEIVFVFPYWWGSAPAIVHNFIDWNFSRGFAFEYVNSHPKGLLGGKEVRILTTTGAPSFIYALTGVNRRLKNTFKKQIINFCGMKLRSFHSFGGVDIKESKSDAVLKEVAKIAAQ